MRKKHSPETEERVTDIAHSLLSAAGDLKRVPCPDCGQQGLYPRFHVNAVSIHCTTPTKLDEDYVDEFQTCKYTRLVHMTDIKTGPFAFSFAEAKPAPKPAPRKPPTRARRRA